MTTIGGPVRKKVAEDRTPDSVQMWVVRDRRKEGGLIVHRCHSKYAAKLFIQNSDPTDREFLSKERVR